MNEPIAFIEDYSFSDSKNNAWGGKLRIDLLIFGMRRKDRAANFCKFMKMLHDAGILYDTSGDAALFSHEGELMYKESIDTM